MTGRLPPPPGTHVRACVVCGRDATILHGESDCMSSNPLIERFETSCEHCGATIGYAIAKGSDEPTLADATSFGELRRRLGLAAGSRGT